jgi:hypothetical protein
VKPVDARQEEVHQDEVRESLLQTLEGPHTVLGKDDLMVGAEAQDAFHLHPVAGVAVDD